MVTWRLSRPHDEARRLGRVERPLLDSGRSARISGGTGASSRSRSRVTGWSSEMRQACSA